MRAIALFILAWLSPMAWAQDAYLSQTACYLSGSITSCFKPVNVASGGTGLTSGTSGGIPYYSSSSAITSSALLTQYGVLYGGGSGGSPSATAADATTTDVLHGGSPPSFTAIASGDLPAATSSAQGAVSSESSGSFSASFTGPRSTSSTITYYQVGKVVVLGIPSNNNSTCGSAVSHFSAASATLPAAIRPTTLASQSVIQVQDQSSTNSAAGGVEIDTNGAMSIWHDFGQQNTFTAAGNCGWYATQVTYSTAN